ncbi:transcription antitermination factor NusB [Leptotrichia hongkongensis]|uniref:transcription antitermination factor NusB n=1 Tax=Leptotrichia hongkongensis TaxID=554406 RepID=UPI0035A95FCD
MTRRKIREEIFKLLFEYELINNDIEKRINDVITEENLKKDEEIDFLRSYVTEIVANESILIERIKDVLEGWTYERLGTIEKVLLKVSFYEITIKNVGYEIAINEVLEIAKKYSYNDTKDFLNGILAKLIKNIKEEKYR